VGNLPAPWDGAAARVAAYREQLGGYIDDPLRGRRNVNRTVRAGYRLSLLQSLGDWSLKAGAVSQEINARDTQYAVAGLPSRQRRAAIAEPHDNDFTAYHLAAAGPLGWADAQLSLAAVRHRVSSRYDATAAPPAPAPPGPLAFDDDTAISSLVAEGSLAAPASARVQWLAGGFAARTRQRTTLRLGPPDGRSAVSLAEARGERLTEAALFGEVSTPAWRGLRLTVGGRLFTVRSTVASTVTAGPDAPVPPTRATTTGFAPKLVVAYELSPASLVYLQAAEGYRAPGVNTTAAGTPDAPPRFYGKDELWSFEAGVRARFLDSRLFVRAAVFEARWKDIQSDELLPSGLPYTANSGDGAIRGAELEASYRDGPLRLQAALLLNEPELDRPNPSLPARHELTLAGVPKLSGGVLAHYDWPLDGGWTLGLDGRAGYVGHSRLTFDATTSPRMGGYVTSRVAVSLADARWRLSLAAENPLDARGDTFAYGNPFTLRLARQLTPVRPRTVTLTFARRFGEAAGGW
jgi:outer membrane receptor protein involved in Fe transport